jgi:hypothetical protein
VAFTTVTRRIIKVLWWLALACGLLGATFWWMNRDTSWDGNGALAKPGELAPGRTGVILVGTVQPSRFKQSYWTSVTDRLVATVIPWPVNLFAKADKGVVLTDPGHAYAPHAFVPDVLFDVEGKAFDLDGTAWMDRYKAGQIIWVPPSATKAKDSGYFLYAGRKQGMPTLTAKISAKARYLYYGQLNQNYLPQADQTNALAVRALQEMEVRHPNLVGSVFVGDLDQAARKRAVGQMLDAGVESVVLGSTQPIYSDFEDMRGSFSEVRELIESWRTRHGNKPVRIVVAPWMAQVASFDALWLDHFSTVTPEASTAGQGATAIIALHGLPLALGNRDSWSKRWPIVTERLKPKLAALLRAKGYARVKIEVGAEMFADPLSDPDDEIDSVNELLGMARRRGDAVATILPIEFLAESSDSLFAHAAVIWDKIPGVKDYAPPPRDQDWSKPYVRRVAVGKTTFIYAGAPGGAALPRASHVLADAVGRVLP